MNEERDNDGKISRRRFLAVGAATLATLSGVVASAANTEIASAQAIGVSTDGGKNSPIPELSAHTISPEINNLAIPGAEIDPNHPASLSNFLDYLKISPDIRNQYFKEMEQFAVGSEFPHDQITVSLANCSRKVSSISLPDGDIYLLGGVLPGNFDALETSRGSMQNIEFQKVNINNVPGITVFLTNKDLERVYGPAEEVVTEIDGSQAVLYPSKGLVARYNFHLPTSPDNGIRVIEDLEFFNPISVDVYKQTWGTQNYKNFGK